MSAEATAVVITGPTASGKSRLALRMAEAFGGTIINADAMQVYRELPILSAQPSEREHARAPHRLFGILSAREPCSAGRWRSLAHDALRACAADRRLPIIIGGAGLYLKSLIEGLAPIPPIPPAVRARAAACRERLGAARFHKRLAERDPDAARRIAPSDRQRVTRAWEVIEATGRTLAYWQKQAAHDGDSDFSFLVIVLMPAVTTLYAACDMRLIEMVAHGAVAEVSALETLGLDPRLPIMKAVGVPEIRGYLAEQWGLDEAVSRAQRATRRYAKRQRTWLRHQLCADVEFDADYSEELEGRAFAYLSERLLTPRL